MIVSIDIETTGLDPATCQILEIGAFCERGEFQCYVDHDMIIGELNALQMNHGILKKITERPCNLIKPAKIADAFLQWLRTLPIQKITIAGKNFSGFDKRFLDRLWGWSKVAKHFHHRYIDIGNLYWLPNVDGDVLPDLKACMDRAGILGNVPHTSLEDARIVHKLVKRWKITMKG